MESNIRLKENIIKNCTYFHFDEIMNINDLDLDNILLEKKSFENILAYDVACKK